MADKTFHLLARRRFLPLFVSQFFGAANDNFFKNALVILVVYQLGARAGMEPQVLATVAAGLFISPYFLFSATAGQMADRFEKSMLMKGWKAAEIAISALGAWALVAENVPGMLVALFLLGLQSTFTSPIKYAVLPEYLKEDELIGGNALIEGGTFLAILLGTIAGGTLVLVENGLSIVAWSMVALATLGFAASLALPQAHGANPQVKVGLNLVRETATLYGLVRKQRDLFLSVMGISWFWLVGATYLSQFPAFAKDVLVADEHVVTLMLTMFSIGIGVGSVLCGRMLNGEVSARHVPFAALGMTLFALDLWFAAGPAAGGPGLAGLSEFLARPECWRVLADLLAFSVCGGIYIVPLYAILQAHSDEAVRSRVVAANNLVNAAFIVAAALASAGMLAAGFTATDIFLTLGLANLGVAIYICGLLPDTVLKGLFAWLFRRMYRVEVRGLENLPKAGLPAVIVVNHTSFLDPALLAAFFPQKPVFAINTLTAKQWWVKPFLRVVEAFPVDPTNPMSTKSLIRVVQEGKSLVIFPEGRLTVTGALMKIYEGPGMIADRAGAPVVPIRIDGAEFTPFSRLKGKLRLRWFPTITITVLPPRRFDVPDEIKGRVRRRRIGIALYDVMSAMMFETAHRDRTLFGALLDTARIHGGQALAVDDVNRKPLTYDRLVASSLALGRVLSGDTRPGEAVGLLLPNAAATAAAFFALQATARVPAMLNFSTGAGNVLAACQAARIATIVTSRRFIDQARLSAMIEALEAKVRVLYLEDIGGRIGAVDKIRALLARPFAATLHRRTGAKPDDPAVILFTSGSEGTPKGVVLSHANILSNCAQLAARVAFSPTDIVFNALPVFHSFGLTGGLLLPVLAGIKVFLYPSPLHYRIVPELVYDTNATILFGTDTFLSGYARVANPYDFYSVRYVFAGAEKVKDETRRVWMDKFGLRILEGYGATETAPVLAVNTPMHFQAGSVGRLLPGISHRLESMPGIDEGGRLWVKGPNVMLGYYRVEKPGELEPPPEGWYDTGDIVTIDDLGFVRIVGRAKRFAKIAGEMVSLGKVEAELAARWPEGQHAVVALADDRKGEQLVMLTDRADATRDAVLSHFRAQGLAELLMPKVVLKVDRIPLLGTGKTDYVGAKALAEALVRPGGAG
ncbi:acyl-[ACP]--phospholipid O-acyltransferase [Magnetospirillum moscoviense]|uniref:2-acyl-glycerophospho-ethanolamine acyltransferase n=1 Tax=Magnetospirillum moscoviense TaxID=1437059 RepID=A0A178MT42_9PROT|nr:acyl-[ACP]--phospholipid O-acyltransferase [Magnetospirillum moscoviense]OAN51505.1 2-acyl-glycerophospho-ethanolamine acyltransferase [Magnetospirillum moscoviense]